MAARNIEGEGSTEASLLKVSGKYHFCSNSDSYYYVKKTGYLVKSPLSAGKVGRWRRRWCKLMDMIKPDTLTNMPRRQVRLEYYTGSPKNQDECSPDKHCKMKGSINLHSCIAVVGNDSKIKGHNHVLSIIMSNAAIHHLAATSEEERDQWITAFNEFIFVKPLFSPGYFGKDNELIRDSVYTDFLTSSYYKGRLSCILNPQPATNPAAERRGSVPSGQLGSVQEEDPHSQGEPDNEDALLFSYDYITNDLRINTPVKQDCDATADSDSEPDYWNEPPNYTRLQKRASLKKSNSADDILEKRKLYVLKLPQVDNATLNTRWSLSSAEDEDNEPLRNGATSVTLNLLAQTPIEEVQRSLHAWCPPEYDQYCNTLIPPNSLCIRRTVSNPTLSSSTPTNMSPRKTSCVYYNADGILAFLDFPPPSNKDGNEGFASSPATTPLDERPQSTGNEREGVSTSTGDLGTAGTTEHLYFNTQGELATTGARSTATEKGKWPATEPATSKLMSMVTEDNSFGCGRDPNMSDRITNLDSSTSLDHSYCNLKSPFSEVSPNKNQPHTDKAFEMPEKTEDRYLPDQSSTQSEDHEYYNHNSYGWNETGNGEYYNVPEIWRSLPAHVSLKQHQDEKGLLASVPPRREKKPTPCAQITPDESNASSHNPSGGASDHVEKVRQEEAGSRSSPPVTPRRNKKVGELPPKSDRERVRQHEAGNRSSPPVTPRKRKKNTEGLKLVWEEIRQQEVGSRPVAPQRSRRNKQIESGDRLKSPPVSPQRQTRSQFPKVPGKESGVVAHRLSPSPSPRKLKKKVSKTHNGEGKSITSAPTSSHAVTLQKPKRSEKLGERDSRSTVLETKLSQISPRKPKEAAEREEVPIIQNSKTPPVSPRKPKSSKKEGLPKVGSEKITTPLGETTPQVDKVKVKLTKVLSRQQAEINKPQLESTTLAVAEKLKKCNSIPYQVVTPKVALTKTVSYEKQAGKPRSADCDLQAHTVKKPMLLPARHKKLSESSRFGGNDITLHPSTNTSTQHMLISEPTKMGISSPDQSAGSDDESECNYVDIM